MVGDATGVGSFFLPPITPSFPFLGLGSSAGGGVGSLGGGGGSLLPPIRPKPPFFLGAGFCGSGDACFFGLGFMGDITSSSVVSSSTGGGGWGAAFFPPNLPSFLGRGGDAVGGGSGDGLAILLGCWDGGSKSSSSSVESSSAVFNIRDAGRGGVA